MLLLSIDDFEYRSRFEDCQMSPEDLDHWAHLRLAYVYLVGNDDDEAYEGIRDALHHFLKHNSIDPSKYHDTMTRAWMLAVRHFMEQTERAESAEEFIDQNPSMLDPKIMLTHYSCDRLFSEGAREEFVEPDLDPIPRYGKKLKLKVDSGKVLDGNVK